jgi:signal peptidase I
MNVFKKEISIATIGVVCILFLLCALFVTSVSVVRVTSSSMEPSYCEDDLLLVLKNILFIAYRPNGARVGDVCLFSSYKQVKSSFIKRVSRINRDNGMVFHYYVLGDNVAKSLDSRDFGAIPAGYVRGLVLIRLSHHSSP